MGEFAAGGWAIGLLLYFFFVFFLIFTIVNIDLHNPDIGINMGDISVDDPGFQDTLDPFVANGTCGGYPSAFCRFSEAVDNSTCQTIPGCTWDGTSCTGFIVLTDFGGDCRGEADLLGGTVDVMNRTLCELVGCSWTDFTSEEKSDIAAGDSADFSSVKQTFALMTGFSVNMGEPSNIAMPTRFLFIYLPLVGLLFAIYMMIPGIH